MPPRCVELACVLKKTVWRKAITREMEQGRKEGMNALESATQTRKNCSICDGSFGACTNLVR